MRHAHYAGYPTNAQHPARPQLIIGSLPTGPNNALTNVPGVRVGCVNLHQGDGPLVVGKGPVRTGITVFLPHPGNL